MFEFSYQTGTATEPNPTLTRVMLKCMLTMSIQSRARLRRLSAWPTQSILDSKAKRLRKGYLMVLKSRSLLIITLYTLLSPKPCLSLATAPITPQRDVKPHVSAPSSNAGPTAPIIPQRDIKSRGSAPSDATPAKETKLKQPTGQKNKEDIVAPGAGAILKFGPFEVNVSNVNEKFIWILISLFVVGFIFYAFKPKKYEAQERAIWATPVLSLLLVIFVLSTGYIIGFRAGINRKLSPSQEPEHRTSLESSNPQGHPIDMDPGGSTDWGQSPPAAAHSSIPEARAPMVIKCSHPSDLARDTSSGLYWYLATGFFLLVFYLIWTVNSLARNIIDFRHEVYRRSLP
jgi:hypothetical protein